MIIQFLYVNLKKCLLREKVYGGGGGWLRT